MLTLNKAITKGDKTLEFKYESKNDLNRLRSKLPWLMTIDRTEFILVIEVISIEEVDNLVTVSVVRGVDPSKIMEIKRQEN